MATTIEIRRHTIGAGGVAMTSQESGAMWYAVLDDNDGSQHRYVEAMVREDRRDAALPTGETDHA